MQGLDSVAERILSGTAPLDALVTIAHTQVASQGFP
jgi:hypothetical protein